MAEQWRMAGFLFRRSGCTLLLSLGVASGCSSSERTAADTPLPPSFFGGGAPATVQPTLAGTSSIPAASDASGGAAGAGPLLNPCAEVPEGQLALIDDFEDSNQ